jgi:uncharacterized RmlC-like cupin family protein
MRWQNGSERRLGAVHGLPTLPCIQRPTDKLRTMSVATRRLLSNALKGQGSMNTTSTPTCKVIRSTADYQGKQGPTYAGAISAESVGSPGLWFGKITVAPGARTKAHYHEAHETAMFVVSGEADIWFGDELREHEVIRAGEYLYVPAGVSHVAVNGSKTEPMVVIAARTDPNEQESVVLQPHLDVRVAS